MPSNVMDAGPRDRATINMNEPYEVRYWSKELNISVAQLKATVAKAGTETDAIRRELATRGNRLWQS